MVVKKATLFEELQNLDGHFFKTFKVVYVVFNMHDNNNNKYK